MSSRPKKSKPSTGCKVSPRESTLSIPLWLGPALLILLSPVCLQFLVRPELRYHGALLEAPVQVWLRRPGACLDVVARACVGFDAIPGFGVLICLIEASLIGLSVWLAFRKLFLSAAMDCAACRWQYGWCCKALLVPRTTGRPSCSSLRSVH
jgi:hypothetical protein